MAGVMASWKVVMKTTINIIKTIVDALEPGEGRYARFDAKLTGFGVRVYKTGRKVFIYQYRKPGSSRKTAPSTETLGDAAKLTAEAARKMAKAIAAKVFNGADPALERAKRKIIPTLSDFADRYLAAEKSRLKPGTHELYSIYFRCHICPVLGTMKLSDVAKVDVRKLNQSLGETKKVTANRVVQAIFALFRHAVDVGVLPEGFANPAAGIKPYREQSRERFLNNNELEALGKAMRELQASDPIGVAAVKLLLFLGCRLRELLHARWADVDLERGVLQLTDSKTGRRTVALNAPALSVLSELNKIRLSDYIIAGHRRVKTSPAKPNTAGPAVAELAVDNADVKAPRRLDKHRADLNGPWRRIQKAAGLEGVRLHDLRHSHASRGTALGVDLYMISSLLGHTQVATTQRYAHHGMDNRSRASDRIASSLAASLGDVVDAEAGTDAADKVVQFKR
jgi:integrase